MGGWCNSCSVATGRKNNAPGIAYRCTFSNIFLHREQFGNTFVYDGKKNVVSASARSGEQARIKYDDFDNLTSYVRPGAAETDKYVMTYGSTNAAKKRHLPITATTPEGLKTTNTYDAKGNLTQTVNQKSSSDPTIGAKTVYDTKGNYVKTVTDARGKVVTKTVDETTGLTASVTDPASTTVNYTYDTSKRVTGVSSTIGTKTYKNAYTYENDRIKTVSHNTTSDTPDVTYTFGYDALGRKTSVKVGEQTLSTNVYATDRSSLLKEVQYGNGGKAKYAYDSFDRLVGMAYDGDSATENPRFVYEYGANGRIARVTDKVRSRVVTYEYDLTERPLQMTVRDLAGNFLYRTTAVYDRKNQLESFKENAGGTSLYSTTYAYDKDGRATQVGYGDATHKVDYTYDKVGRVSKRTVTNGSNAYATTYGFAAGDIDLYGSTATTPLVSSITQPGMNFSYTYDSKGHITGETRNGLTTNYFYDGLGQLIRVNDPHENVTWRYEYDSGGNMTKTRKYVYTTDSQPGTLPEDTTFMYDKTWKDQLVKFGDREIKYDAIGNMLTDGKHANQWVYGRRLRGTNVSATGANVTYEYNTDGLRAIKNVTTGNTTVRSTYDYHGNRVTHHTSGIYAMHFFYDAQGKVSMARFWDGTSTKYYAYVYNLQGDVVKLIDSSGNTAVEYKYDAWGKAFTPTGTLAGTLGKVNPFRYRGYVYDEETGYYYLRSRYYDPELRRFISADSLIGGNGDLLANNIYLYCSNNSINFDDQLGRAKGWEQLGFKYDGSRRDARRRERGDAPYAFSEWIKSGTPTMVDRIIQQEMSVVVKIKTATYIPSDKTASVYDERAKKVVEPGPQNAFAFVIGAIFSIEKIASKIPGIGIIIMMGDAISICNEETYKYDLKYFKGAMEEGEGILVVEWAIEGAGAGNGTWNTYYSWDGESSVKGLSQYD